LEIAVETRTVKLFRNGRNQAVRIPRELELPGKEALLSREGDVLTLRPAKPRSLLAVLKALPALSEGLPPARDRAPEPVDL
jgi:antitoxin VapB